MKTQIKKSCLVIVGMLFATTAAIAKQPSFSKGIATQVNAGLIDCGDRSRISAVGEIKSEDGKVWTVPANTNFETATKATDLYNECGGDKLNSLADLDLSKVPVIDAGGKEVFTAYIFPDNYFELYINGVLIAVDPVPFTPFNASVVRFKADRSFTIAVKMVDWEETLGLGMESNRGTQFHAGDGGLVAHFQDAAGKTVTLTDSSWKAQTFYTAPIVNRKCLVIDGEVRDSSACDQQSVTSVESTSAAHWAIPDNWMKTDFDDSAWPAATTFSNDTVGVDNKKSYTNFTNIFDTKGADAEFIWSSNLVLDNVVLLRKTVANSTAPASESAKVSLKLTSPVIQEGGKLPLKYTCDGGGVSPPLSWSGIPKDTKSLVFIMDHLPQANTQQNQQSATDQIPNQNKEKASANDLRYYWLMYNVPVNTSDLSDGESTGTLGSNIVNNDNEYAPPCSKGPGVKQYTIHMYALSDTLNLGKSKNVTATGLRENLKGLVLESASLNFSFERSDASKQANTNKRDEKRPPKKPDVKLNVPTPSESISSEACSRIQASVAAAGYKNVTVTCDKTYAYVQSDTYPNHSLMNGITGTNEQIPVPALNYAAPILLNPEIVETKTSIDAALGVAINGVPIYDYSAQGEIDLHGYDASKDTTKLGQLDECGGHAGRGDDYHYHAKPTCMIDAMKNVSDATIIGWGYDGFPLYGDANPDGTAITKGDLDVCNGQTDKQFGYRYHTSVEAPYIIQCLVGKVDTNILPRVAPLSGAEARADLRPPREGVENLKHVKAEDGTRTLNYTYKGTDYYTRFKPSKTEANCYDFEQKTISNNVAVESGTYCR